jgi:protease I
MTKKALLIIAFQDYQDIEYGETRKALEKIHITVTVASTKLGMAQGKLGGTTKVDLLLEQVKVDDYDTIIFIGGPGAVGYITNEKALEIARKAKASNKLLSAICIAPAILAKAGVLSGKKATIWTSEEDKSPIKFLEEGKAEFIDQDVVVDGRVITACGPHAAKKFGETIAEILSREK